MKGLGGKKLKKLVLAGLLVLPILAFVGCTEEVENKKKETGNQTSQLEEQLETPVWIEKIVQEKPENLPTVEIKIKDYGTIKAELYPHKAPNTVANFVELANSNFYDGLTVHRVIDGFVMQGGCPVGNGTGGPEHSIKGEFSQNGFSYNDIKHTKGVLSMARSGHPDSAGSQFFIMTGDAPHLDGQYAGFGKVTEGIEIVDKINGVETGRQDMPIEKIVIEDIAVNLNGVKLGETAKVK
ncbi:MAG: peptidylprolyl isomerase [Sarcina sp.]